jgi:transcriptional regulator with XRE-family HTH domain
MIGKIERGKAQPTAALLGRLSGALRMTFSELVARAEGDDRRLVRVADQPTWMIQLAATVTVRSPRRRLRLHPTEKFGCFKVVSGSARATGNTNSTRGTVSSSAARRRER